MSRRRSARHARPTGRGALAAAYTALEVDVARLRSAGYADHLELIRLSALVDGLMAHVGRLTAELREMRRELHAARSASVATDPYVELLAAQVSELRATVATQQAMLADLTRRLLDLLTHLETVTVAGRATAPAAPAPVVAPVPPAYSTAPAATAAPPAAAEGTPTAGPSAAGPHVDLTPRAGVAVSPPAGGHVAGADEALDDETVLRLRLIRESFGR